MFWKKNAFSYIIWLLYSMVLGSMVVFMALYHISGISVLKGIPLWGRLLVAIFPVVLLCLICLLARRYVTRHFVHEDFFQDFWKNAEIGGIVVLLLVGTWLRYMSMDHLSYSLDGYSQALVTEGSGIPYVSHGASYLYLQLLRGFFLIFGNKAVGAIWLQIMLFYLAGLFLHRAFRRMVGVLPSLCLFGLFILTPYMVEQSLTFSPMGLYLLLYFFTLFYLTEVLQEIHGKALQYFFGGVLTALCTYLDFMGVTLVFWAFLLLLMHGTWEPVVKRRWLMALTYILGLVVGMAAWFGVAVLLSGKAYWNGMLTWWQLYLPHYSQPDLAILKEVPGMLDIVVLCMIFMGVISFWFRRKTDRFCPMVFMLIIVILPELFGMSTGKLDYSCWIILQLLLIAVVAFWDVFDLTDRAYLMAHQPPVPLIIAEPVDLEAQNQDEDNAKERDWEPDRYQRPILVGALQLKPQAEVTVVNETTDAELEVVNLEEETVEVVEKVGMMEESAEIAPENLITEVTEEVPPVVAATVVAQEVSPSATMVSGPVSTEAKQEKSVKKQKLEKPEKAEKPEKKKTVKFLENPLPVPKRHARRNLEYAITELPVDDDFDLKVADNDDYDY